MSRLLSQNVYLLVVMGLISLCCAGCGGGPGDQPDLGEVTGKVTLDGEPLVGAMIIFDPEEPGRTSSATTDENGAYELNYVRDTMGAMLGKHKVSITTHRTEENPDGGPDIVTEEKLPAKYHLETELTATVEPAAQELNFDLTSQ